MNREAKKISIACLIRDYTYTAHVSKATGKLSKITAGCRTWKSFKEADRHYERDKWNEHHYGTFIALTPKAFAQRLEARSILARLRLAVETYQLQCSERRKLQRRKRRAVR